MKLLHNRKIIMSITVIGLLLSFTTVKPKSDLKAAVAEKIGIYTNSFGYYIYVADPVKNRVIKYTNDGLFLSVIIPTTSTHASGEKWVLKKVVDIVTCRLTDVIGVADAITGHSYIYELNGHTHHKNGNPGNAKGQLVEMWDVAMTEVDEIKSQALLDRKGSKVSHWTPPPGGIKDPRDGTWVRDFGGAGSGAGALNLPEGMTYDKKSILWVADTGNNRITSYDLKGNFLKEIKNNFNQPCDVGVDFLASQGNKLYVLDRGNLKVHMFSPDGKFLKAINLTGMKKPSAMTIDADNFIWVTDIELNQAFKFDQSGKNVLTIKNLITPQETVRQIVRVFINKYIMTVNDVVKAIDVPPFIQSGRTLVPIRAISEGLGAKVEWEPKTQKITIRLGSKTVELWIGKLEAKVNGKTVKLDVPPMIKKGRTFVPIRFVSEALGAKVDWNPKDLRYGAGAVTVIYPQ
ncbi:hypothetical protein LLG10_07600 [bacterium]|nr:hypothetical protein [bacterium]